MKKFIITLILIILILATSGALAFWYFRVHLEAPTPPTVSSSPNQNLPFPPINQTNNQNNSSLAPATSLNPDFSAPLTNAKKRVTKKPFGIYVTPTASPVKPERFTGYHTGTDFEIFPNERDKDVPVHAVCKGKLLEKITASGYGGVAVQSCTLNNEPITIVYGHLKLPSISAQTGQILTRDETLGTLGTDHSNETGGERKHLHLGFHKGSAINILGYVSSSGQLSNWVDPCLYVCY